MHYGHFSFITGHCIIFLFLRPRCLLCADVDLSDDFVAFGSIALLGRIGWDWIRFRGWKRLLRQLRTSVHWLLKCSPSWRHKCRMPVGLFLHFFQVAVCPCCTSVVVLLFNPCGSAISVLLVGVAVVVLLVAASFLHAFRSSCTSCVNLPKAERESATPPQK